jgi:hypothetical protein
MHPSPGAEDTMAIGSIPVFEIGKSRNNGATGIATGFTLRAIVRSWPGRG